MNRTLRWSIFSVISIGLLLGQSCNSFEATRRQSTSLASLLGSPFSCGPESSASPSHIRRLSKHEYANSLKALVGESLYTDIEGSINTLPDDKLYESLEDFQHLVTSGHLAGYEKVVDQLYFSVSTNVTKAQALAGDCIAAPNPTDSCIEGFIKDVGLKAYRRPLRPEEVAQLKDSVYSLGDTPASSVAYVMIKLILSPDFLFHLQFGDNPEGQLGPDNGFLLTQYEVASRLSYLLWDAPPDKVLYSAASKGQLTNQEQIQSQVNRMLDSPKAKEKLRRFFSYYVKPESWPASYYSKGFLDTITEVESVSDELEREMYEYIDHIVWEKNGTFEELLTNKRSFARTPAAAGVYGASEVTEDSSAQFTDDNRMGLLLRTPVIANGSNETRPILRGVKFRNRFLCEDLGLPSGVLIGDDEDVHSTEAFRTMTTRQRTTKLTSSESCMACHAGINPFGYALEGFDSLGRHRDMERAFDPATGEFLTEHPIDTSVTDLRIDNSQAVPVSGAKDLVRKVATGSKGPACFARQMFRFYSLKEERKSDGCVLSDMFVKVKSPPEAPGSIVEALKQIALSDAFLKRKID